MDDSKRSIHMKTYLFVYFSINRRFCLVSLGNPTFSNMFPRSRHVLMTFEFWTLYARLWIFSLYISFFAPVISASIHRYVNYFDIQVLMMVTETETLTSTLHHNIFTYLDYVFFCYFIVICVERERELKYLSTYFNTSRIKTTLAISKPMPSSIPKPINTVLNEG